MLGLQCRRLASITNMLLSTEVKFRVQSESTVGAGLAEGETSMPGREQHTHRPRGRYRTCEGPQQVKRVRGEGQRAGSEEQTSSHLAYTPILGIWD